MNKIVLVPTLKDNISDNSAWCASFALAWKEFQNEYLENDFKHNESNQIIKNLMTEGFLDIEINEKDYYVKSGRKTIELKKEIEKAIKEKFNTESDILKEIKFDDKDTINILIYSMLKFNLEFPKNFENFSDKMLFGDSSKKPVLVNSFGIENTENFELYLQVDSLFYNSKTDFALSIDSKDDKKIVLYRTDDKLPFEEVFKQIQNKTHVQDIQIRTVQIPNLSINLFQQYEELNGEAFVRIRDNQEYIISQAIQTLQFDLNKDGAKVKSEAVIDMVDGCSLNPTSAAKVDFIFNNTFYLFIVEKESPIVALRVQDIKEFVKDYLIENINKIETSETFDNIKLFEVISIIKNKKAYKYIPSQESDGNVSVGWYDYDSKIMECHKIIGEDYNYLENFKLIQNKNIKYLTKDELKTYATRIFRGERFCDGLIARCIDDGTLESVIKRYLELC